MSRKSATDISLIQKSLTLRSFDNIGNHEFWMTKLPLKLQTVPLTQLAIPGSHDSFSFSLDQNGPIGPSISCCVKTLISLTRKYGRSVAYRWSATQDWNISAQLHAGIRYFDFRVSTKPSFPGFFFVHGFYGMNVEDILLEIKHFLDNHPQEFILLDFNHFYIMSQEDHQHLLSMILRILGGKLCPFTRDLTQISLQNLWNRQYQIIAFYQNNAANQIDSFWPASSIMSPWANTPNLPDMLQFITTTYHKPHSESIFFVTQGILTPTVGTVFGNLKSSLKEKLANAATPAVSQWLFGKSRGKQGINIVIVDFIEIGHYISNVLALNKINEEKNIIFLSAV